METNTPIDIALREQMDERRQKALAAIAVRVQRRLPLVTQDLHAD